MPDTVDVAQTPVRLLLRGRFGWFFLGRTVDVAGTSMTTVALALAVLKASGNATDLGIVLAVGFVPTIALLLVGGAVADRMSRRGLLINANLASGILMAAMAALLITGRYHLALFAALSFLNGIVSAFITPALRGIVPELVERHDLQRANALLSSTRNTVRILAPVAASLLVATAGGGWSLAIDAATFFLAALCFTRIPGATRPPGAGQPLWRDLADGWSTFRSLRWVVLVSLSCAFLNGFNVGPWNVLGPQIVTGHDGALGWGTVLSVRAVGLLVTSVVAVKLVFRRPLRSGRIWGVLCALPLIALGLSGSAWVVAVAGFIGGLGFSVSAITWDSTMQAAVPQESLSRVAAYDDLFSYAVIPVSQVLSGPLAQAYGAKEVCAVGGFAYVVVCLFPLLNRQVRTM
ncbi:MFS transporter [Actinoplanes sp. HUAS TT8]|uniref:MFS transporter n=1 Tax=Actinoplanes sp. HUAS TT8 TaxID=3447453 RepID=UPI003F524DA6